MLAFYTTYHCDNARPDQTKGVGQGDLKAESYRLFTKYRRFRGTTLAPQRDISYRKSKRAV